MKLFVSNETHEILQIALRPSRKARGPKLFPDDVRIETYDIELSLAKPANLIVSAKTCQFDVSASRHQSIHRAS